MLLLNRRGYATAVFCRQCGDTFECPNCSVSLTVHTARQGWRARCHYCNHAMTVPKVCRKCAAPYLEQAGFGTERVEQVLRETFPQARVGRVDRDAIRRAFDAANNQVFQLYDLGKDFTQSEDIAAQHPDKVTEMRAYDGSNRLARPHTTARSG